MSTIRDIAAIIGVGLVLFGLAQWSAPLAYVTGGALLTSGACAWSWMSRRKEPQ